MAFGIYQLYHRFQPRFRQARRRRLLEFIHRTQTATILDLGGNVYDWYEVPTTARITVLNLALAGPPPDPAGNISFIAGDACQLPFADQSFDLVYSNSVIEHLATAENQRRFASEARRVGRALFIQTPNRWFPIEPHFIAPFFHFLPKRAQSLFLPHLSLRSLLRSGDNADLHCLFAELRLLSARQLQGLFPESTIQRERLFGLTKSLIAAKPSL
jgi:hypothetical protein